MEYAKDVIDYYNEHHAENGGSENFYLTMACLTEDDVKKDFYIRLARYVGYREHEKFRAFVLDFINKDRKRHENQNTHN